MNIGHAIKLCRQQRKLTQTELADRVGVSTSYVSLLERGHRDDPSISSLEKIAKGLDIPITLLLFLAADDAELAGFNSDLRDKLSVATFDIMRQAV